MNSTPGTKYSYLLAILIVFGSSGCAIHRVSDFDVPNPEPSTSSNFQEESSRRSAEEIEIENILFARDQIPPVQNERPIVEKSRTARIPVELNRQVLKWIKYFTEKDRERFQRFLDRGQLYREVVENTLEENDLPAELYYLAMIESGFRTDAHSKAKAVGVWQFIPGTARRYGLRIDSTVDERKDPIRATEAAAKYLRDLYNVFGSWHLAMAAYNAGEIRILRAVFKGRTRNFWELIESKSLPSETANYVPKFLAVTLIGQNPEKYGFRVQEDAATYPDLKAVEVPGSLNLEQVAKISGVSSEALRKVNPHLSAGRTPAGVSYDVWVPKFHASQVERSRGILAKLVPRHSKRNVSSTKLSVTQAGKYVVRRGDSLNGIARKYKVSVGHLMRMNHLTSTNIRVGAQLRVQAKAYAATKQVRYKVRRGDNLTIIANRFKTSVEAIKSKNRLKKNQIWIGQILKIAPSQL